MSYLEENLPANLEYYKNIIDNYNMLVYYYNGLITTKNNIFIMNIDKIVSGRSEKRIYKYKFTSKQKNDINHIIDKYLNILLERINLINSYNYDNLDLSFIETSFEYSNNYIIIYYKKQSTIHINIPELYTYFINNILGEN